MARLFTADLHLGHANVIRYCDRPFADVDEMDRALVAGWNAVVADDDEVWVLGDLAMGPLAHSLEVAAELQGRKHLVIGNHDRPFHGKKVDEYEAAGFELHHGTVELVLPGGVVVHACHFPYVGDSGDLDRHVEDRPIDDGGWLLHGHVHEKWRQRGRMVNVGVDAWGGRPVEDHALATLVAAGEHDLAPLRWSRSGSDPNRDDDGDHRPEGGRTVGIRPRP
ncbi:MAG: metallophosphoesterase [Actinobacteria bacterium]|nr:metallophosphoesterase [Actinomycetota bacterium]